VNDPRSIGLLQVLQVLSGVDRSIFYFFVSLMMKYCISSRNNFALLNSAFRKRQGGTTRGRLRNL
jgi:hypothetical protein